MSESWASVGMGPLPLLAPSFRVFGDNPRRVWAKGFESGSCQVDLLDDRWVVDTTDVPKQEGIHPGDAIAWIGDYEGGPGLYLWPPSRVLSAEQVGAGTKSRIRSLRDSWLVPLRVKRVEDSLVGMSWKKAWEDKVATPVSRVALQWWGLDVWCPSCGDLGKPASFGMLPPPLQHEDFFVEEWGEFHTTNGGCVEIPGNGAMKCPRCGWQWAEYPINSSDDHWRKNDGQNYWPHDACVSKDLIPAHSRTELMRLIGVTSFDLLIGVLESDVEPDTYVLERPDGLEIQAGNRGVYLDYPMSVSLIYEYIDELETEYYAEIEDDE